MHRKSDVFDFLMTHSVPLADGNGNLASLANANALDN